MAEQGKRKKEKGKGKIFEGNRTFFLVPCSFFLLSVWFWLSPAQSPAQIDNRPPQNRTGVELPNHLQRNQPTAARDGGNADQLELPDGLNVDKMLAPGGLTATLKIMLLLTVLSLAPSILIMTTCFIRFVIVLGLLRQALGTQQLPPNQVMIALSLFLTFLVMSPVWQEAYQQGVRPYTNPQPGHRVVGLEEAVENTMRPLRRFMSNQIEATGNSDAVWMFLSFQNPDPDPEEALEKSPAGRDLQKLETYDQLPLSVLLPAFMVSELKTAFVIGFQLYLPFLVIDMVVASVLISMGMMMLPPVMISLPFKLLLFVMIDGWYLTVEMMLDSVQPFQ